MQIQGFSLNIEPIIESLKKSKPKRIALQLPEGLKNSSIKLVDHIQQQLDVEIMILADPCYGACDIPTTTLESLHIEMLLHIGHTPLAKQPPTTIPIKFISAVSTIDIAPVITKAAQILTGKKIGLITTAQHLHKIPEIIKILKNHRITPIVGIPNSRTINPGQILGCNFSAAHTIQHQVDVFLYIGSGMFHPLGITLATKKPIYVADPFTQKVVKDELDSLKEIILRQRYGAIEHAKQSQRFGIILSSKAGQQRINIANQLQQLLQNKKKSAYILIMDRLTPDILMSFRTIQCYISTACPRVAIDDYQQYSTPVLTPIEAEIAVGLHQWTDYVFDEIINTDDTGKT
jgi:2-(3-amino-3-carboxypropyl)histidine synthase